jgi:DNA-binding NarL/FixJ family response regulator
MRKMDGPIKVLLVDDHTLFREGVAEIIAANAGIQVVGEAGDGVDMQDRVSRTCEKVYAA